MNNTQLEVFKAYKRQLDELKTDKHIEEVNKMTIYIDRQIDIKRVD